ncbi:MAG: outer membrane beta-barrel protein [Xanthomonadales bacterium]|nr:outer membrane beta-barrel protein [Xanthomonadales bacterium]
MLKKVGLVIALTVFGSGAFAASKGGFYVSGAIGSADADDRIGSVAVDDSDTGYQLLLGFDIFSHFSIEGGYVDFGEAEASVPTLGLRTRAETDGAVIGSRYQYEFADHVFFQARAGVFLWDIEANAASGANIVSVNNDGTDLYYGLGVRYDFDDHWGGSVDWTRHEADLDIDFFAVSLYYYFDF